MSLIVARAPITRGLVNLLKNGSAWQVASSEAPQDIVRNAETGLLIKPYAVVYALPSTNVWGSLQEPEEAATLAYQVTSVGRTDDHAQALSDLLRKRILDRLPSGEFTNPLPGVIERRQTEFGLAERTGGDLAQVVDIFDLEVHADG